MIRVGIAQKFFCYIGTLCDQVVPVADGFPECVYIDLADGRFIVAFKHEIIYL
jgi:hypothetical protein